MSAELCLHFAAACLTYFLKVTAAFLAGWILNRLLLRPRHRFIVWMIFLVGSAAYWLELVVGEIRDFAITTVEAARAPSASPNPTHPLLLPLAWNHNIVIAIEGLGALYISVCFLLVAATAWKHLRMRVLLRYAVEPSPLLSTLLLDVSRDLRLAHSRLSRTKLMVLPGLKSPATAGFWNPRILLPEVCEQIGPTPQVADVLCHELIHVARRDYLWAGLSDLICCLLFFHPAVWKARKMMALQAELACDLAVLETRSGDRADYADSLAYFVRLRMLQEGFSLGVDFAASTSLGLRIRTILTTPKPVAWWKTCSRAAAGLSLIAAVGIVAPFIVLSLGFAVPLVERVSYQPSKQLAAEHSRNTRHLQRHQAAAEAPKDSLTTLRTQPYISETPVYTMTSNSGSSAPLAPSEGESPAWQKSQPSIPRPSVASVVRTTLGEIVVMGRRGGRDHDRDDH
ncbi:MAG TPA: M56 family metallopeptidase [Candidatus Angelobacter sp.]|jgi:beta-lactamase regulating signal transducer with metallopeptidase domain